VDVSDEHKRKQPVMRNALLLLSSRNGESKMIHDTLSVSSSMLKAKEERSRSGGSQTCCIRAHKRKVMVGFKERSEFGERQTISRSCTYCCIPQVGLEERDMHEPDGVAVQISTTQAHLNKKAEVARGSITFDRVVALHWSA
jgi:hypothetical protein